MTRISRSGLLAGLMAVAVFLLQSGTAEAGWLSRAWGVLWNAGRAVVTGTG